MNCINEKRQVVDYNTYETREINLIKSYIQPDDCVLELGARYGGTSIACNLLLKDKTKQVSVEPDSRVWKSLEENKKKSQCQFTILKGTISKEPQKIIKNSRQFSDGNDWATYTEPASGYSPERVENYPIPLLPFNVLIADCEGFLETFYNENKNFFKGLRLIILEKDRPDFCNYDRLKQEFLNLGFFCARDEFHSVYIKP